MPAFEFSVADKFYQDIKTKKKLSTTHPDLTKQHFVYF